MFNEVVRRHRGGESSTHLFRNGDVQVVERTEISEDDLRVHRDLFADGAGRDFLDRSGQHQVDHGLDQKVGDLLSRDTWCSFSW